MTRFWISIQDAVFFVSSCFKNMVGGEVFVPKMPSIKTLDLAKSLAPQNKIKLIGKRPGEKIHECLISEDHSEYTYEKKDSYVTFPDFINLKRYKNVYKSLKKVSNQFSYNSLNNPQWILKSKIKSFILTNIKKDAF